MFISQAKRMCRRWLPILCDEDLSLPPLESIVVGRVKDRQLTSEILQSLKSIYPWPKQWKHVRRLNQLDDEHLEILLYPSSHLRPFDDETKEKYFHSDFRSTRIPLRPLSLRWQFELCQKEHWPNLAFREDKALEQTQITKALTPTDQHILQVRLTEEKTKGDESIASRDVKNSVEVP